MLFRSPLPPVCAPLNTSASAPTVNIAFGPLVEKPEFTLPPIFPNLPFHSVATLLLHSDTSLPLHIVATTTPSSSLQSSSLVPSPSMEATLCTASGLQPTANPQPQALQPSSEILPEPIDIPIGKVAWVQKATTIRTTTRNWTRWALQKIPLLDSRLFPKTNVASSLR